MSINLVSNCSLREPECLEIPSIISYLGQLFSCFLLHLAEQELVNYTPMINEILTPDRKEYLGTIYVREGY